MINLSINEYFNTIEFINNKNKEINDIFSNDDINTVKLIEVVIEINYKLISYNLCNLSILESNILEFVKKCNDNLSYKDCNLYIDKLNKIFIDIKNELKNFMM